MLRTTSPASLSLRGGGKFTAYVFAACAALFLSAWAPKPAHIHVRSIGIIAAVGDTCMFAHVTDQPLEWIGPPKATFLEISDWGIDDEVTKDITTTLGSRYDVQSIPIEHQDFDTWSFASLTRRIRELPVPEIPVDAYLLVLRDWHADTIGGSDHRLVGLGVYRNDLVHGRRRYAVFAAYRLVLAEPNSGKVIASLPAIFTTAEFPELPLKPELWPRTQNDLSNDQRKVLRTDFLDMIEGSLPTTLEALGLATKPE